MKTLFTIMIVLVLSLSAGDAIHYDLKDSEHREIQAAYQGVIEAKREYDAAREKLEAAVKATDETMLEIKERYGHGGRRSVQIIGEKVVVTIAARETATGNITDSSLIWTHANDGMWRDTVSSEEIINSTATNFNTGNLSAGTK
ncbi:MAG: hypothetical protein GY906_22675 [bacterium]|nr:hypothetical protein [bacterium]